MAVAEVRHRGLRTTAPLAEVVAQYASHRLFQNMPDVRILGNPYRRPLNADAGSSIKGGMTTDMFCSARGLPWQATSGASLAE